MQYRGLQPTDRICTLATQITGGEGEASCQPRVWSNSA